MPIVTKKLSPILPNISMTLKKSTHKTQTFSITPIYTKKIITLKKDTYKLENTHNPFL